MLVFCCKVPEGEKVRRARETGEGLGKALARMEDGGWLVLEKANGRVQMVQMESGADELVRCGSLGRARTRC